MGLEFHNISHAYDSDTVLAGINLAAPRGEVTCLLGPSGCGKTTLLRLAAGLMPVQAGEVTLDGEVLGNAASSLPPEKRPVGLVFQEGALFPHLTVEANISFGLTGTADEKAARVEELLSTIGLEGYAKRYPHTMSGGQQQRVALARALAPAPKVLLLDEPFANIDSQLRHDLREEARRTLKASDTAVVLVTHDPEEALEMGDRIAVMDRGRIVQVGSSKDLFDHPVNVGVATMFGRGQKLRSRVVDDHLETVFGNWHIESLVDQAQQDGELDLVVRQDLFDVAAEGGPLRVVDVRNGGQERLVFVATEGGDVLRIQQSRQSSVTIGDQVKLIPKKQSIFAYSVHE